MNSIAPLGSNPTLGGFRRTQGGETPAPGALLKPIVDTSLRLLDAQAGLPTQHNSSQHKHSQSAHQTNCPPKPRKCKTQLAQANVSVNRKEKICQGLARFYRSKGIPFVMPRYNRIQKLPFIPLETEIDQIISGVGNKTATFIKPSMIKQL